MEELLNRLQTTINSRNRDS
jgi:hypothetical protein